MYYPYLRGKQYELISLRDSAALISAARFVPILEPVKERLNGLKRTLDVLDDVGARVVLVANPNHGDHANDGRTLRQYVEELRDRDDLSVGILLTEHSRLEQVGDLAERFSTQRLALIHAGFADPGALAEHLAAQDTPVATHVFFEKSCGKLYRRHFPTGERVLVRDGFKRRNNRDHPPVEAFSDLHVTYGEENVDGFGDFSIVGDDFFETGGPAYAVAIHLTFIDPTKDDEMYIYHFVSDRSSSPKDPAGKFAEALQKLVDEVERPESHVRRTSAVDQFFELHASGHFPGLGVVKKLSMNHHVETLFDYLSD